MLTLTDVKDIDDVEHIWRDLERRADHSFFLAWPWVRTWWVAVHDRVRPQLLTITDHGQVIAAAFVVSRELWRRGVLSAKTAILNATGDTRLDELCIEYNGLLTDVSASAAAWEQLADYFQGASEGWEELQLQGVPMEHIRYMSGSRLNLRTERVRSTRYVDLATLRSSCQPFLKTLGKKTRAHIRHTAEAFSRHGEIRIAQAQSSEEALRFFQEMKVLHERRWMRRGRHGAFSDPIFNRFHEQLITDFFTSNVLQFLRVTAGAQTVGILYNFLHRSDVFVYQTGFNYDLIASKNKESPGLLTHALAIEYNLAQGNCRYDLLAGDSDYKRALAKDSRELWWGTVQRDSFKFRAEQALQQAWWKFRGMIAWGGLAWLCDSLCPELLLLS